MSRSSNSTSLLIVSRLAVAHERTIDVDEARTQAQPQQQVPVRALAKAAVPPAEIVEQSPANEHCRGRRRHNAREEQQIAAEVVAVEQESTKSSHRWCPLSLSPVEDTVSIGTIVKHSDLLRKLILGPRVVGVQEGHELRVDACYARVTRS